MNSIITNLSLVVLFLSLVTVSGVSLVNFAISFAKKLNIPTIFVGATIIAFGTSAPELFVSLTALFKQKEAIVVGNVVGSNILNILLGIGISSIIYTVYHKETFADEHGPINFLFFSTLIIAPILLFTSNIGMISSLLMLVIFALFIKINISSLSDDANEEVSEAKIYPTWFAIIMIIASIGLLSYSSSGLIDSAVDLSRIMGISEKFIAITLISLGTSLPEIVTGIISAIKRHNGLLIGNIVGSNIFNLFLIFGLSGLFAPFRTSYYYRIFDIPVMIGISIVVFLISRFYGKFNKITGFLMLALYVSYVAISYQMP